MHTNVKMILNVKDLSQNMVNFEIKHSLGACAFVCMCIGVHVCACVCVHMPLFSPAGWAGSTVTLVPVC